MNKECGDARDGRYGGVESASGMRGELSLDKLIHVGVDLEASCYAIRGNLLAGLAREETKMTSQHRGQRVRERAYELWERAERPDGKAMEFWLLAEAEIVAEEQGLEEEIKLEAAGVV